MAVVPFPKKRGEKKEASGEHIGFQYALRRWREFAHRRDLVVASSSRLIGAEKTFLGDSDDLGVGPKDYKLLNAELLFEDLPVTRKEKALLEEIADTLLERGDFDIKDVRAPSSARVPDEEDERGRWEIMLTDRQRLGTVVRTGEGSRKRYKMYLWWEGEFQLVKGPPCFDIPLFGLPELRLREDDPVMLHEGPKARAGAAAAGRLESIGMLGNWMSKFVHLGWHGADIGIEWTDWSVLRGRRVLIWSDMDEPGLEIARTLGARLARMGGIIDYVQWSVEDIAANERWDWGDPVEGRLFTERMTRSEIKARVQRVESPVNMRGLILPEWARRSFYDREKQEVYMVSRGYRPLPLVSLRTEYGANIGSSIANSTVNPFVGTDYRPGLPYGRMTNGKINLAPPNPRDPMDGRPLGRKLYERLVRYWLGRMVPDVLQRKHLIRRMAWAVGRPEKVPHHMIILQGESGIGKSVLMDLITWVAGVDRSVSLFPDSILSKFNAIIGNKSIVCIHEIHSDEMTRKQNAARLKELVANETITFEEKNRPRVVHTNVIHWFAATNEEVPFSLEHGNDRFYFIKCAAPRNRMERRRKDEFFLRNMKIFKSPIFQDKLYAAAKWLCDIMEGTKYEAVMVGRARPQAVWKELAQASMPAWAQRLRMVLKDMMELPRMQGENHPPVFYSRLIADSIHAKYHRNYDEIYRMMGFLGYSTLRSKKGVPVSRRDSQTRRREPIWCRSIDRDALAERGDFATLKMRSMLSERLND